MDLNILSAGASKRLVESLQAQFSAETGVGIHGTFGAVGAIKEKALAGEPCDVIILTAAMIDELARFGQVFPGTVAPLGRVHTAYAVGVYFKAHQPELARHFAELLSGETARELRLDGEFQD